MNAKFGLVLLLQNVPESNYMLSALFNLSIIVGKNLQTYNIWSIASEYIEEVGEQNTTQPDGVTLS